MGSERMLRKKGTSEIPSLRTIEYFSFVRMCNKTILNSHHRDPETSKSRKSQKPSGERVLSGPLALPQIGKLRSHKVFDSGLKVHRRIEALVNWQTDGDRKNK